MTILNNQYALLLYVPVFILFDSLSNVIIVSFLLLVNLITLSVDRALLWEYSVS